MTLYFQKNYNGLKMERNAERSKYFWLILLGLLLHITAQAFFMYIGHTVMSIYNLFSILVFAWSLYYMRRNEYLAVLICFAEPMIFCIFGVLNFGWSYDIQNWTIAFCIFSLIIPFPRKRPFFILALLNAFVYCGLFLWVKINNNGLNLSETFFAFFSVISFFFAIFFIERLMKWGKIIEMFSLQSRIDSMERIIDVDELTGLLTRRKMNTILAELDKHWASKSEQLYLVFIDIDFFKKVNDTYGHDAGDIVLATIAGVLKRELRGTDLIARWGGEEFVAVMQPSRLNETLDTAKITAVLERVRREIEKTQVFYKDATISVTATFGGVRARGFKNTTEALSAADHKMYEGKTSGRNCIMIGEK